MIPGALTWLIRRQYWGNLRRVGRRFQTVRGAIFAALGTGVVLLWLASVLFGNSRLPGAESATTLTVMPWILLGLCALNLASVSDEKAIYFSPAEVNFLFVGPFTRRQLLTYRLITLSVGVLLSALFLSLMLFRHATSWLTGYVALALATGFIQFFGMTCLLGAQVLGARRYNRSRWIILGILAAVGVLCIQQPALQPILLAPFRVFAQAMLAPTWPGFAVWSLIGLAMNAGLVATIYALDVDFIEAATHYSEKMYARIQRARAGNTAGWSGSPLKTQWRLPMLPHAGGIGVNVWRQLLTAIRSARAFLVIILALAACSWPIFVGGELRDVSGVLIIPVFIISMVLTARMTFDFRGDVEHMATLKSLPISAVALVIGQLLTPVLLLSVLQAGLIGLMVAFRVIGVWAGPALLFLLPINWIVLGADNLLFLLFPTRQVASGPADFQFIGRSIALSFAKLFIFGIAAGIAVAAGAVGYFLFDVGMIPAMLAGWVTLVALGAGMLPLLVLAFHRYDVGTDTPA